MAKDASFQMLIDMCQKLGWDIGILQLERIVLHNENMQAELFAGTPSQVKQAQKLGETIIKQNLTIGRLRRYRFERGL